MYVKENLITKYSILNKLIINNWTNELIISKEYIIKRRIINMELNIQYRLNIITANDNNEINKEPAKILIDNRLDKVKDCKIIEKDSSINKIIKNSSILVKNKYNRYATRIKPKYPIDIK